MSATDKNMTLLFEGDTVVLRAKVTHVEGDHVLTVSENPPVREYWFIGSAVERVEQGKLSLDKEKQAATTAAAKPAPTPIAGSALSPKDEAIAYVESRGYAHDAAVQIVEKEGTDTILKSKAADAAEAEKEQPAGAGHFGLTTKDEAVAYLEAKGHKHEEAVSIVEEEGVRAILAQKAVDPAFPSDGSAAGQNQAASAAGATADAAKGTEGAEGATAKSA